MKHIYYNFFRFCVLLFGLALMFFFNNCKKDSELIVEEPAKKTFAVYIEAATEIPTETEIPFNAVFIENEDSLNVTGKIGRRGGVSIGYAKHSYKVDLKGDFPIGGLVADDDWILNANHIDKSFMRHTLSYELFKKMNPANNIASNWRYIEVYLNEDYRGLYVLMERLDRSTLMIEKPDTSAFIFKDPPIFRESLDGIPPQEPGNIYQQSYPDIDDFDKTGYLQAVRNFLLYTDDTLFSEKIDTIFDIDNIIDWHLLIMYSNNGDGILKNFFLYKKSKNHLIQIAPWDYDHSFGRYGNNALNLDIPVRPERANLLNRLLKLNWYTTKLKKRWTQLNNEQVLGAEAVSNRIDDLAKELKPLADKNFEVWQIDGWPFKDATTFSEETEVMKEYLNIRQNQLEQYFSEL